MNRRDALKGAGTILMAGAIGRRTAKAATSLEPAAPEILGFAPDLPARFAALESTGRWLNVRGVVAVRKGRVVRDRYMTATDRTGDGQTGNVEFTADTLHDMR